MKVIDFKKFKEICKNNCSVCFEECCHEFLSLDEGYKKYKWEVKDENF